MRDSNEEDTRVPSQYRPMPSDRELGKILRKHLDWVGSDGEEGQQADLSELEFGAEIDS